MSITREIQVVIVGAGIAGLSLAGFLQQVGIDPVVIETADEFDERGAVVELWPETMALLEQLEVADQIRDAGTFISEWKRRRSDGTVVDHFDTDTPGGFVVIPYERLRGQLVDKLGPASIRMGTTLHSLEHTDAPVTVRFEDGVREKFDLVVGADAIHSRTRELLGGSPPVTCGTTTWTFPLPGTIEAAGVSEIWTAEGVVFRVLPVGDGSIGVLTSATDRTINKNNDQTEIDDMNTEIDWLLPEVRDAVDPEEVRAEADMRSTSDLWTEGHVALVGDAAHAPHHLTGLGPTLAIEDAAVLVSELVDRDDPLPERLMDYAARRRSRLQHLPDRPGQGSLPPSLNSMDGPADEGWSRILDIRADQLTAAFGSETPQPAVSPLLPQ